MLTINIFKKTGDMNLTAAEKLANMPPLPHSVPGQSFDINNSEAAKWVASLPEVMHIIWNMAATSGAIKFNHQTGCWSGVDALQAPESLKEGHKHAS